MKTKPRKIIEASAWFDIEKVAILLSDMVEGNQKAWAQKHRVSAAYVNDVLRGRRIPGDKITSAMGLEKALLWRFPRRAA